VQWRAGVTLRRSGALDVALAQKFGFQLCQCTYPPQIMLWHEQAKVTKCPRPECGRAIQEDLTMPLRVEPQVQRPRQSASATMEHVHAGGNLYAAA